METENAGKIAAAVIGIVIIVLLYFFVIAPTIKGLENWWTYDNGPLFFEGMFVGIVIGLAIALYIASR